MNSVPTDSEETPGEHPQLTTDDSREVSSDRFTDEVSEDLWVPSAEDSAIRLAIPVSIILEQRLITRSFWSVPSWYLHAVAVGESLTIGTRQSSASGESAGKTSKGELFAWTDFEVTLYKDACERYWHALIGDNPLVYVICREVEDDEGTEAQNQQLQPVSVTIDYDAASAAAETDVPVLSAPIPAELYRYMERFVLTHYKPQEFKKRKRRNWSGDDTSGSGNSRANQANRHKEDQQRD